MFFQTGERHGDSLLQLRIVPLAPERGVEIHLDVRRNAFVLDVELSRFRIEEAPARRRNSAPIDQCRVAAYANQATPGACADQRADAELLEHPGQRVTAGARILIDQHDLRAEDHIWDVIVLAFAGHGSHQQRTVQPIHDVVRDPAAAIEAFVDDRSSFCILRKVVSVEVGEPAHCCVRQIDVGQLSFAEFIHFTAIAVHPVAQPQIAFAADRHHGHRARIFSARVRPHLQLNSFAGPFDEETIDFVAAMQFTPVDSQQVIPLVDVHARLCKRRAQVWIPVLAEVHLGEAVATMIDGVVRAQQADADGFHFRPVATRDVNVLRGDFAQHVGEDVVQVRAAHYVIYERLIGRHQRFQIGAVKIRIVEPVAFDAANFAEHLLPLGARIHVDLHGIHLQGAVGLARFTRLPQRVNGLNRPGAMRWFTAASRHGTSRWELLVKCLLTIGGNDEAADIVQHLIGFARAHVEFVHDVSARVAVIHSWALQQVQHMGFSCNQSIVIPRGDRQRQDALIDVLKIDLHFRRFFGLFSLFGFFRVLLAFLFVGALISSLGHFLRGRFRARLGFLSRFTIIGIRRCFGSIRTGGFISRRRDLLLVALRSQRRFQVLAQHNHVSAGRDGNFVPPHARDECRSVIRAGYEIEVLPVLIKSGGAGVAQPIRQLVCSSILQAIHEHGTQRAIELARVRNPAAVRRPRGIESRPVIRIGVHEDRFFRLDVQIPEV